MTKILKKDGIRLEEFDRYKIYRAVELAMGRTDISLSRLETSAIAEDVYREIQDREVVTVNELHDVLFAFFREILCVTCEKRLNNRCFVERNEH